MALARYRSQLSSALRETAVPKSEQGSDEHTEAVLEALRAADFSIVHSSYLRRLRDWANAARHENEEMRAGGALPKTVSAGPMPQDDDEAEAPTESLSVSEAPGKTEPPAPSAEPQSGGGDMPDADVVSPKVDAASASTTTKATRGGKTK